MHELASCFCPYQLYPHDTLCTYGVKQFGWRAFRISRYFSNQSNTSSRFQKLCFGVNTAA